MEKWEGKVCIITGASAGIGASISKVLVQKGLLVVGLARRIDKIESLSKSLAEEAGKLYALKCDITREDDIVKYFNWITNNIGPVHVLINNAYLQRPSNLTNGSSDDWRRIFEVNVIALSICTREAVKIMTEHKIAGHIVHMNSIAGHYVSPANEPNMNVYPASKFAVTALSESLRHELRQMKSKIKITSISPGFVRYDADDGQNDASSSSKPALKADDVAEAVVYALSTGPNVQVQELILRPLGERF